MQTGPTLGLRLRAPLAQRRGLGMDHGWELGLLDSHRREGSLGSVFSIAVIQVI